MHISLAVSMHNLQKGPYSMCLFHPMPLTWAPNSRLALFLHRHTIFTHHAQPQSSGTAGMVYYGAPASAHSSDAQATSSQSSQVHCHVWVYDW
jgi:hypothetical protein